MNAVIEPPPVILTTVRTQGGKGRRVVALGPDFRQDDGAQHSALVSIMSDDDIYVSIDGHGYDACDRASAVLSFFANLR